MGGRDVETQELVDKVRRTFDAVLKGAVEPDAARDHLRRLVADYHQFDRGDRGLDAR